MKTAHEASRVLFEAHVTLYLPGWKRLGTAAPSELPATGRAVLRDGEAGPLFVLARIPDRLLPEARRLGHRGRWARVPVEGATWDGGVDAFSASDEMRYCGRIYPEGCGVVAVRAARDGFPVAVVRLLGDRLAIPLG